MDFAAIYNVLMTVAIGFIGWSLKELYNKSEKRHDEADTAIKELSKTVNEEFKDVRDKFVTRDQHDHDINAVEQKIDNIRDILLEIKEDIGRLTGKGETR